VKVLDFGIAKLAEVDAPAAQAPHADAASATVDLETNTLLFASDNGDDDIVQNSAHERVGSEAFEESDTRLFVSPPGETKPALPAARATPDVEEDGDGTLLFDRATRRGPVGGQVTSPAGTAQGTGLTRVGALMGTPLYMSPEQCRGAGSDTRSDIYSLGVIAYQMLAGATPFTGDTESVIRAHNETPPSPLRERSRKVPKRVARTVMSALAKDPAERPQTAHAFASSLRAQADGIGSLYRRAFALYSEYFPKFLRLSLIAHLPVIVCTLLTISLTISEKSLRQHGKVANVLTLCAIGLVGLLQVVSYFVAGSAISGMTAIIVTQLQVAPLRPVQLRTVFAVLKRRWRPFLNTSIRLALRIMIGYVLLIIPGLVMQVRYVLWAPVVLMEGLSKKAALKRARELASRSWRTIIIVSILQVLIPAVAGALVGRFSVSVNRPSGTHITVARNVYQQLSGLVNILVIPLMSIVPALLYLKMRQLGGETLSTALAQIEDLEGERTQWQQRMRSRLTVHTPQGH
jgi:hypothetical protein